MLEEAEFIQKLKNPSTQEASFRQLVTLNKERLYWHIRKIVLSHEDADDVLQNTFVKIFRHVKGFRGDSKLMTWMYKIATNEAISFLNKKAREAQVDLRTIKEQAVENLKADVYFDGDEIQLKLQEAIVTLPEKQQLVFNMKYFDNLKYQQMSEILDTSVGSLKASYHHARKKIETHLLNH